LSDARYKQRIQTVQNALSKVESLRGVSFEWNPDTGRSFPKGPQIGFVAQEVRKVLPQLVSADEKGYLSVQYSNVVPVLVEAIKQQQTQIAAAGRANARLQARLRNLELQVQSLAAGRSHQSTR
ncbi:MAG TPA: tail fiber domain-containing protein, partial [Armatimonadota bacterium]